MVKYTKTICPHSKTMSKTYPVVSEIWTLFEGTLQTQAKRLVEDIAKHQKADPKALWAKIKSQIRVGLVDIDIPDSLQTSCTYPLGNSDGAVRVRCRAPCVLGFHECQRHVGLSRSRSTTEHPTVDRVFDDYEGKTYFVDRNNIARDKDGRASGYIEEGVIYLFEYGT
jgi:hypothetical protein